MTRITVPSTHIAISLPLQLADEIFTLAVAERTRLLRFHQRNIDSKPEAAAEAKTKAQVWGDLLLKFIEAGFMA